MDVKTFSEIVNSIDLYELSNKRCSKLVEADNLYKKSGINYIYELLREKLDKVVPDTEIFVEYSIISSTLEPGVNGLSCFSCISGNKTLKTNIENWMSKIVSEIYKRDGYSIYHHADFFLAPERGKSITSSINVSFSDEFKYSHKPSPSVGSYIKPIEFIETSISNLYVQNQSFERTYANMVANSHDIINNIGICIKEAHEELHFHYHNLFLDKTEKEEFITCYISIPIFGSRSSNILKQNVIRANANQGQGACFIFVKIPNSRIIDKKKIENIVTEELFVEINELVRIFSINYIFNLGLQLQDHVCKEAIKSAVSAIMARNMSHNLGSHIITNTKNEIKKIAGELTNDIKNAANFRGLSDLLQYLQERQDFIAVIANGDKYSYAPLNLKSGIFDVLAMDGLSKRHAGSQPVTNYILNNIVKSEDVFRKLSGINANAAAFTSERSQIIERKLSDIINNCNSISGLTNDLLQEQGKDDKTDEKIKAKQDILDEKKKVLFELFEEYIDFDGASVKEKEFNKMVDVFNDDINTDRIPIELQLIDRRKDKVNSNELYKNIFKSLATSQESSPFSDIELAVPYGINGRHAFLSILENIIRNSAKHGSLKKEDGFVISIAIEDNKDKNGYVLTIFDNLKSLQEVKHKFINETIVNHKGELEKLSIIDDDTNLINKKNKGIKEMLICLLWLSGSTDFWEIENEKKINQIMRIVGVNFNESDYSINIDTTPYLVEDKEGNMVPGDKNLKDYSLGYQFEVKKYSDVCYCDYNELTSGIKDKKELGVIAKIKKLDASYLYVIYNIPLNEATISIRNIIRKVLPRVCFEEQPIAVPTNSDDKTKLDATYLNNHTKSFINSRCNGKEPVLYINDNRSLKNGNYKWVYKSDDQSKYPGCSESAEYNDRDYIEYSTHYEVRYAVDGGIEKEKKEKGFIADRRRFVEGISGGNFTYNLVIPEITESIYGKIIESAYTNIVIVDERIYSANFIPNITSPDEIKKNIESFIQYYKEQQKVSYKLLKTRKIITSDMKSDIKHILKSDELNENAKINGVMNVIGCITISEQMNYKDEYLRNKGVYVFNCDEKANLIDLSGNLISDSYISMEDNVLPEHIDYISVHYSLFEKLNPDIKTGTIIDDYVKVFAPLRKYISSDTKIAIHSGRGGMIDKNEDNITFIPLSGLEWALSNCKHVLVELFSGQKYTDTDVFKVASEKIECKS